MHQSIDEDVTDNLKSLVQIAIDLGEWTRFYGDDEKLFRIVFHSANGLPKGDPYNSDHFLFGYGVARDLLAFIKTVSSATKIALLKNVAQIEEHWVLHGCVPQTLYDSDPVWFGMAQTRKREFVRLICREVYGLDNIMSRDNLTTFEQLAMREATALDQFHRSIEPNTKLTESYWLPDAVAKVIDALIGTISYGTKQ